MLMKQKFGRPHVTILLRNSWIKQPNFSRRHPTVIIKDNAGNTLSSLATAKEGDRDQLLMFYNACRGFPRSAVTPTVPVNPQVTTSRTPPPTTTTQSLEDAEFAMAINASIQSAISEGALPLSVDIQSTNALPPASPLPSAPPINTDIFYNSEPIHYPSVDSSPISFTVNTKPGISGSSGNTSNSCVVCLDGAVEGACIPCGHMAGCMPCLNEINARQWGCPVCRTPIQQVIKLYTV